MGVVRSFGSYSLGPTTGTKYVGSKIESLLSPNVAMRRSTASWETFAVDTIGYEDYSGAKIARKGHAYKDEYLALNICGGLSEGHDGGPGRSVNAIRHRDASLNTRT